MWGERPLTPEQLNYASDDVVYLIQAWDSLRIYYNDNLNEIISFLSIIKVVDYDTFNQFKEYLIANIIYYNMYADDVLDIIIGIDFVYNFLQFKLAYKFAFVYKYEKDAQIQNEDMVKLVIYKKVSNFKHYIKTNSNEECCIKNKTVIKLKTNSVADYQKKKKRNLKIIQIIIKKAYYNPYCYKKSLQKKKNNKGRQHQHRFVDLEEEIGNKENENENSNNGDVNYFQKMRINCVNRKIMI